MAGTAVLGIGTISTLATWTDSEWVFGGIDGAPNVGTSTFEVRQNTSAPFDDGAWSDEESNPGGNLIFTLAPTAMTPGDSIYAPVALQTTSDSVAGTVALGAAVPAADIDVNDAEGDLWAAISQSVVTDAAPFTCDSSAFADTSTLIPFAVGALGTADADGTTQSLAAESESTQYYCVRLTLSSSAPNSLQGRTIAPAWMFAATSN